MNKTAVTAATAICLLVALGVWALVSQRDAAMDLHGSGDRQTVNTIVETRVRQGLPMSREDVRTARLAMRDQGDTIQEELYEQYRRSLPAEASLPAFPKRSADSEGSLTSPGSSQSLLSESNRGRRIIALAGDESVVFRGQDRRILKSMIEEFSRQSKKRGLDSKRAQKWLELIRAYRQSSKSTGDSSAFSEAELQSMLEQATKLVSSNEIPPAKSPLTLPDN